MLQLKVDFPNDEFRRLSMISQFIEGMIASAIRLHDLPLDREVIDLTRQDILNILSAKIEAFKNIIELRKGLVPNTNSSTNIDGNAI